LGHGYRACNRDRAKPTVLTCKRLSPRSRGSVLVTLPCTTQAAVQHFLNGTKRMPKLSSDCAAVLPSSPSAAWIPPTRSDSVGFDQVFNRVAVSGTHQLHARSAMVRAARASSSVPISSMTMTSGIWFSTASIINAGVPASLHPTPDQSLGEEYHHHQCIRGVDNDYALIEVIRQNASNFRRASFYPLGDPASKSTDRFLTRSRIM